MNKKKHQKKLAVLVLLCVWVLLFTQPAGAASLDGFGPIKLRSQHPVYLQTLQLTPMRARSLDPGAFEVRTDYAYSSIFEKGIKANNRVLLDMEMLRVAFNFLIGFRDGFELGVELPFLHFDEGFLDKFIDKYHSAFGFPTSGRETENQHSFNYNFRANGNDLLSFGSHDFGLSDIVLHLKHNFWPETQTAPALAWFFDVKLPTGDRGDGLGSGEVGFGWGAAFEKSHRRFHGYGNLAYYLVGANDLIADYMYDQCFAYMLAAEWNILPTWSVIVQLTGGTPLLKSSNVEIWDGVPLDLVLGFRGEERKLFGSHDLIWQFGFSEDITARGPAVDFSFFFSLGVRFNKRAGSAYEGDWFASLKP